MSQAKGYILCVDDDEETCALLDLILSAEGYQVVTARTVNEALSLIAGGAFDLYIIDERLPDGAGGDLCRRIRADDLRTPILIHSGLDYEAGFAAAIAAGANEYLMKPLGWSKLLEMIEKLLGQSDATG